MVDTKVEVTREKLAQRHLEIAEILVERRRLFKADDKTTLSDKIFAVKELKEADKVAGSNQGYMFGPKPQPFDFEAVAGLMNSNIPHATCIHTKARSHVGIGFKNEKVKKTLNPLSRGKSFQSIMNALSQDYWQTGNAYLEVVRDPAGKIIGLHRIRSAAVTYVLENDKGDYHYRIQGSDLRWLRYFAAFGDKKDFITRAGDPVAAGSGQAFSAPVVFSNVEGQPALSEVIHFKMATSLNEWYGWPDSIAATAAIELHQCMQQHTFDFFNNRGVPEFMLFFLGAKLGDEDWAEVKKTMKAQIGLGNSRKSMALNIDNPAMKVQMEKLGIEATESFFPGLDESLTLAIVSAHGVPPLLAGIVIPGRLGSANELPNALVSFQTLTIGQAQVDFAETLDMTLGDPQLNGGLGLSAGDFEFRDILEKLDVGQMQTIGSMRQPLAEAQAQGRDLGAGVFSRGRDRGNAVKDPNPSNVGGN